MMSKKKIRIICLIAMCIELILIATLVALDLTKTIKVPIFGWVWLGVDLYTISVVLYFSLDEKRK